MCQKTWILAGLSARSLLRPRHHHWFTSSSFNHYPGDITVLFRFAIIYFHAHAIIVIIIQALSSRVTVQPASLIFSFFLSVHISVTFDIVHYARTILLLTAFVRYRLVFRHAGVTYFLYAFCWTILPLSVINWLKNILPTPTAFLRIGLLSALSVFHCFIYYLH